MRLKKDDGLGSSELKHLRLKVGGDAAAAASSSGRDSSKLTPNPVRRGPHIYH